MTTTFKRFLISLTLACAASAQTQFSPEISSIVEGSQAGSDAVIVDASGVTGTWGASADQAWLTPSAGTFGNGPGRVLFQFSANPSALPRTAHIIVGNALVTASITVTQAGNTSVRAAAITLISSGLTNPYGIAADSQGDLYIADPPARKILHWSAATQQMNVLTTLANPVVSQVALDWVGNLYLLGIDSTFKTSYVYSMPKTGGPMTQQCCDYPPNFHLNAGSAATNLCVDRAGQNIHLALAIHTDSCVIDAFGNTYVIDIPDKTLGRLGIDPLAKDGGAILLPFNTVAYVPYGVTVDTGGYIYFLDNNGQVLEKYDPATINKLTAIAGIGGVGYRLAVDGAGNFYFSYLLAGTILELPRAWISTGSVSEPAIAGSDSISVLPATQSLTGVYAPISSASWLTVGTAGNGTVQFSFAANNSPAARSATITLLGISVGVTQAAAAPQPASLSVSAGNNQVTAVGQAFPTNLQVQVTSQFNLPLPGAQVTFTCVTGCGNTFTVTSDSNGLATAPTLTPPQQGQITVSASVVGTNLTRTFTLAAAVPGINIISGSNQYTTPGQAFPLPFKVVVYGSNFQPQSGVPVTFSAPSSGASGTFAGANVVMTGSDGSATSPLFTANTTAGGFQVTASAGGYNPATFILSTVINDVPGMIQTPGAAVYTYPNVSGASQVPVAATRTAPVPLIISTQSNETSGGLPITFAIGSATNGASGTFPNGATSVTVLTDANGIATSPLVTANNIPGSFPITVSDGYVTRNWMTVNSSACYASPAPASSTADSGAGSLRDLVNNACAGSTIDLTRLTGVITLASRLRIDDSLTINGPGASVLAIDGGNAANPGQGTRLFFIGGGNVELNNVSLQNGLAKGGNSTGGGAAAGMGGAIFMNGGKLVVSGVTFSGNQALGGGTASTTLSGGGGGFGGDAGGMNSPGTQLQGGSGGDLFGIGSYSAQSNQGRNNGGPGGWGAGASAAQNNGTGGAGGFGGGGGVGAGNNGTSGAGGFGGGGGGGILINPGGYVIHQGTGGYGGATGGIAVDSNVLGGGGAGFGGAIFELAGTLILNGDTFVNNSAVGGSGANRGQGKGGAVFIYSGATAVNLTSTFSLPGAANVAAAAGLPGIGSSAAPYTAGATCPGQDTVDICGTLLQPPTVSFTGAPATAAYGTTFSVSAASNGSTGAVITAGGACNIFESVVRITSGSGVCSLSATWPAGGAYYSTTMAQSTTATKATPTITWPSPAPIMFSTPLGNAQLNATANVPGKFVYTPAAGALPVSGSQTLNASFTPTDTTDYTSATASTSLTVNPPSSQPAGVNLVINNKLLGRDQNNNLIVTVTFANTGQTNATNVVLTGAKIGSVSGTSLPVSVGLVVAQGVAAARVTIPGSAGATGTATTLTLSGTYDGGSFNATARVTLP